MAEVPEAVGLLVESKGNVIEVTSDSEEKVRSVIIALSRKYACCHFTAIKRNGDGHYAVTIRVKENVDASNE